MSNKLNDVLKRFKALLYSFAVLLILFFILYLTSNASTALARTFTLLGAPLFRLFTHPHISNIYVIISMLLISAHPVFQKGWALVLTVLGAISWFLLGMMAVAS